MRHLTNLLFTFLLTIFVFLGCGDTPEGIVLEQILREASTYESPYTGGLIRVGSAKSFGLDLDDPTAIEWNGEQLYMLADAGKFERSAQYLFTLERTTGVATFVNRGAVNLGGSFHGRSFTQVLYVAPTDMTWVTPPDHYIEGIDYPVGYTGEMFASCPVLDSIVVLHLDTGTAGRLSWLRDFCLTDENGRPQFEAPKGIAFDGEKVITGGFNQKDMDVELLHVKPSIYRCAEPLNENQLKFGVNDYLPYALTFDYTQQHLYMSGADTYALYIIDRDTSVAHFVANWYYTEMPKGYRMHEVGQLINIEKDTLGNINITGLAHDGVDMFAVDGFTDALYKLETR